METTLYAVRARGALERHGFRFTHSLGQNFLLDENVVEKIVDCADVQDANILEIGPGSGMMTAMMADRGAHVLALELDRALEPVLTDVIGERENVKIIFADAMKADLSALVAEAFGEGQPFRIVANLPYYITADFMMKAVTMQPAPESITVMVQKEAAERMMSCVGEKNWCALSAVIQYYAQPERLMEAPAGLFTPPPHVDSCLIRLNMKKERMVPPEKEAAFITLVQSAFKMRRKTLVNNLTASYGMTKERAAYVLERAGFDSRIRGEALELEELKRIFDEM